MGKSAERFDEETLERVGYGKNGSSAYSFFKDKEKKKPTMKSMSKLEKASNWGRRGINSQLPSLLKNLTERVGAIELRLNMLETRILGKFQVTE